MEPSLSRTVRVTKSDSTGTTLVTTTETQESREQSFPESAVSPSILVLFEILLAAVGAYVVCSLVARAWRADWSIQVGNWLTLPEPPPIKAEELKVVVQAALGEVLAEQAVSTSAIPPPSVDTTQPVSRTGETWDDPRTGVIYWRAHAERVLRNLAEANNIDARLPAMELALALRNAGVISSGAAVALRYLLVQSERVLDGAAVSPEAAKLVNGDGERFLQTLEQVARARG